MEGPNKRRFPRVPIDGVARIRKTRPHPQPPSATVDGQVKNISMGGVFIETDRPFSEGDGIEFEMSLKMLGKGRSVNVEGVVRWIGSKYPRGIGVEFTKVTVPDKKALGNIIWGRIEEEKKKQRQPKGPKKNWKES